MRIASAHGRKGDIVRAEPIRAGTATGRQDHLGVGLTGHGTGFPKRTGDFGWLTDNDPIGLEITVPTIGYGDAIDTGT